MRAVIRRLRTAWLEYEDDGDGVVFVHAASTQLGIRNALALLPAGPGGRRTRMASNLPDLDMRVRAYRQDGQVFRSIVAHPADTHQAELERWICSPGVDGGALVARTSASDPIDLLVISGHGSGGSVWGVLSGVGADLEIASAFADHAHEPRSGRLKCLIVPACNNLNVKLAGAWLAAFNHPKPVYLILGYESTYSGGPIGARVMARFVETLARKRSRPIVDAWRLANKPNRQPWAAFAAKGAEKMSLADWAAGSLPELSNVDQLIHFSEASPGGVPAKNHDDRVELRWVMEDGTVLDFSNNGVRHPRNGLFDGAAGKIRIKALQLNARLKRGDECFLKIYHYRQNRPIDVSDLLQFEPRLFVPAPATFRPVVTPMRGTTGRSAHSRVDGFLIVVPDDTDTLELGFTVNANATSAFGADGPGGSHGRFLLDFALPGAWGQVDSLVVLFDSVFAPEAGALLRP